MAETTRWMTSNVQNYATAPMFSLIAQVNISANSPSDCQKIQRSCECRTDKMRSKEFFINDDSINGMFVFLFKGCAFQ